jgi:hypothetical protein
MRGETEDLLGELDANDEFLDDGLRVWLVPLFTGYGASRLTVASRPVSNLE